MLISYNWLKEYVESDLTPQQLADRLTMAGLEVEGMESPGAGVEGVIVGMIDAIKPHPDATKLTLCDVNTGSEVLPIVCGAKNMKPGDRVPLALVGAALPGGLKIKKASLRGVTSLGMLCSEKELGLSDESSGLMILPDEAAVGEDIRKAVGLDDWTMELNVTPNRPDCLSMVGVAREVAALTRGALLAPETSVRETGESIKGLIAIEIEDASLCPRYAGRVIKGVKVGPSPFWLKRRLQSVGVRSINNIVDVTNYVLMEMGHPLHAFDYARLEDNRIIVRTAADGELFTTLDGVERKLSSGMLLICDGKRPVALAGVMGGQNSEVTESTVDIFLESAYFSPSSIRRTSKSVGLHTEASHRFERGTDPEGLIAALDRAARLIEDVAGGKVATGRADEYPARISMPAVSVRTDRVNALLGTELAKEEVADILRRLQIAVAEKSKGAMLATPPTFRPDLTREADMVEEVARIYGYGKIKSSLPAASIIPRAALGTRESSAAVRRSLIGAGYSEVINYSFVNPADLAKFGLPDEDPRRRFTTIRNPLTEEQSVMRTMLLPSLMANLAWNRSRGVRELKIFEISKVFLSEGPGLPDEQLRVAGLVLGSRTGMLWDGSNGQVDFFDVKGAVETVLSSLRVGGASYRAADEPFMHPGKSAFVMVGGRQAGHVGQLHPDVTAAYDIAADVYVFELNLQELLDVQVPTPKFVPLPRFPAVERDLAVIVKDEESSYTVQKAIEALKIELIEDIRLFDCYQGRQIPEGMKSMAYTLTYRSANRTLTDDEVNEVHGKVIAALRERLGAEIREA